MTKKEICGAINGREIVYAVDGLRLNAIVLAQEKYAKVSIKPLDEPKKVLIALERAGYQNYTLDEVKHPSFCLQTLKFGAPDTTWKVFIDACKCGIFNNETNKALDETLLPVRHIHAPLFGKAQPTCPYGD